MSNRLLSLLTEIERVLTTNNAAPDSGAWDTLRLMNFHQGLARLTISVQSPQRVTAGRGVILLQHFTLADDTQCLKANLSWNGIEKVSSYAIYSKATTDWNQEAALIANKWFEGMPHASEVASASPVVAQASPALVAATA